MVSHEIVGLNCSHTSLIISFFAVPILPDYLSLLDEQTAKDNYAGINDNVMYKNLYLHYVSKMFNDKESVDGNLFLNQTVAITSGNKTGNGIEFNIISDKMLNAIHLNEENGSIGILLAVKALVQLLATPFVTKFINMFGYRIPTICGTFFLFVASLGNRHGFSIFNIIS